ncbi:MAG: glycosyltransferase, partial [Acidobacteria bacterium]|nr:glycosyltransferase [Acidobacteriota bacterium]
MIIDDGSGTRYEDEVSALRCEALRSIEILHLRSNLGHQRAIAIGLAYLEAERAPESVVVMDGDGEDRPEDVERLLRSLEQDGGERIVFAERTRRSEGLVFTVLY